MDSINQNKEALFHAPLSPVLGNSNGNINIVKFMDYQCAYCKSMTAVLAPLIQQNNQIRLIIKEFPIFGENSTYAAAAALAAQKQGKEKFAKFHLNLLQEESPLTHKKILELAQISGLDVTQLETDMKNADIKHELKENIKLGEALKLQGTPAFVLGNQDLSKTLFIPGAISEAEFQRYISEINS